MIVGLVEIMNKANNRIKLITKAVTVPFVVLAFIENNTLVSAKIAIIYTKIPGILNSISSRLSEVKFDENNIKAVHGK